MTFRICNDSESYEDEDHILVCKNNEDYDVSYEDVYSNIDKQYNVTQVFKKILRKRNVLIEAMIWYPSMLMAQSVTMLIFTVWI